MNCIDRKELEQFLRGKLDSSRLVEIDEHVCACPACRAALCDLPAFRAGSQDLSAVVLNTECCPDYEELSAYVEKALGNEQAMAVQVHANTCELCTRDVANMREMRSHAAMAEKISVHPGKSRGAARNLMGLKFMQAIAGLSFATAVAALAVVFVRIGSGPAPGAVAVAPHQTSKVAVPAHPRANVAHNTPPSVGNPVGPNTQVAALPSSWGRPVLTDGRYSVVKNGSRLALIRDGKMVREGIQASPSGSVDLDSSVDVALRVRDGGGYTAPPTAPKQKEPMGKVVLSATPTFWWSKVDLAVSYRVRVYDGGTMVAEETTDQNSLTLRKALARGRLYKWQVAAKFSNNGSWSESAAARFEVLPSDGASSIQRVKSSLPGSHLALGAIYQRYGMYLDAAREYRILQRENPHSALARKLLAGAENAKR